MEMTSLLTGLAALALFGFVSTAPSERTWVLFVASSDEHLLNEIAGGQNARVNKYRIEAITPVTGKVPTGLAPGWSVVRLESDAPIQLPEEFKSASKGRIITFRGVTESLHYTSETQRKELNARSREELKPSNETTAVLIPIGKSLKWWQLAQDQREAYFQTSDTYKGHTAIGLSYVDRVFRKLYHSRYINTSAPYDFLTYFEFKDSHRDDFKKLLNELRDTAVSPEWNYVELEYEIWMRKID
ncbi:MAG: chlorite dismutase family protein [Candidatus Dadabacteria bacterium]|nr:chlorite dismutase family protein [Candidatus Dadabacteria bacterium]